MIERLKLLYQETPLKFILVLGFIIRLVAVIFSEGYGMHDDHFLVIEAAQSWVDGFDYNNWLPANSVNGEPTGHSWFYVGLHYIFFSICDYLHFSDPKCKMFIIRLIHALWSVFGIYFAYKITEKLSSEKEARIVGLLLALLWFFPILSVRNMVEMVSIPFTLASIWYLVKDDKKTINYVVAGIFIGLAIGVRLQVYLIWGGIGLVLLFDKKIIQAIIFGVVSIIALFFTQITDLFLWSRPFAEISQYILYNSTHYQDYITMSWFQYILVLFGLLIPPVSVFILFGYVRSWKKLLLLFLPSFIFIVFHSIYPNKQERFILPIIPLVIISGIIGWTKFKETSKYWSYHQKLYDRCIRFFWILNLIALIFVTPASSKKSRVDAMYYLNELSDVNGILLDRTSNYGCYLMPRFYSGLWAIPQLCYSKGEIKKYEESGLRKSLINKNINYCFLIEQKDMEERLQRIKTEFPEMEFVEKLEPSYIDKLLHFLNPRNENEVIYLYRLYY